MSYRFFWDDPLASLFFASITFAPAVAPIIPGIVLALWARRRVAGVEAADRAAVACALDGAEAASAVLTAAGVPARTVVVAAGPLATFYDPSRREVRLSRAVAEGRSPQALGLAVHEAGHALQHARGNLLFALRTPVALGARLGSGVAWMTFLFGFLVLDPTFCFAGAVLSSAMVLALLALQVVERDANRRGLAAWTPGETPAEGPFRDALDAARWADIAATLPMGWWSRRAGLFR